MLGRTLHWTKTFNFVHVHFLCTQRSFIIKTSQKKWKKYLIASGKLATVLVSEDAPTAGIPEITCSKVKLVIIAHKRY